MTNPIIRQPMMPGNVDVDQAAQGPQEIRDGFDKNLAFLLGLHNSEYNFSKVYPSGVLLSGGIDFGLADSVQNSDTATPSGFVLDLGSVYNFHRVKVFGDTFSVQFSPDGVSYSAKLFCDQTINLPTGGLDVTVASFWATTRFMKIAVEDVGSNQSFLASSWRL